MEEVGREAASTPSCRKPSPCGQQIILIHMESRTLGPEAPSEAIQLVSPWVQWGQGMSPVRPKESLRSREPEGAVREPRGKGRSCRGCRVRASSPSAGNGQALDSGVTGLSSLPWAPNFVTACPLSTAQLRVIN